MRAVERGLRGMERLRGRTSGCATKTPHSKQGSLASDADVPDGVAACTDPVMRLTEALNPFLVLIGGGLG